MVLPTVSSTRLSAQKRYSDRPATGTRESTLPPYSMTCPALVSTVKNSGPLPAVPWETMREKVSTSVRYSVPSAP